MNTIVVGVDGSPESKAALHWAVAEARLRKATLHVVHAWVIPAAFVDAAFVLADAIDGFREEAERVLDEALAEVTGAAGTDLPLEREVVQGPASACLLRSAAGAELLVVGSRGHGGFAGLLLGSVSQQCVHHATCPVVIVRGQA